MGKINIIIQREFNERVRKKSFIITTILTPLLFVGIIAAMFFIMRVETADVRQILVSDQSGIVGDKLESSQKLVFEPTTLTLDQIKQEKGEGKHEGLFGILVIGGDIMTDSRNVQLYTYGSSTIDVESAISRRISDVVENEKLKGYDIENLPQILQEVKTNVTVRAYRIDDSGQTKESSSSLALVVAYLFGFMIYMFVFMYGGMVMQGVIEEKSSKVLEIMVSSVKPFQLMMGKIIGIAAVAITQFFIWVVLIMLGATAVTHFMMPDMSGAMETMNDAQMLDMMAMNGVDPEAFAAVQNFTDPMYLVRMLGGFLIYFIGGYLLYAAMFAAIGSAVENSADAQQLQLPITIPMILAIVVMMSVMREPHSSLAVWFSIIPFTSPIIMVARLPYGVPVWELAASIAVLYVSFIFMVWLAGKIYRVGIFMYGKKPTFKELFKWARYKY